MIGNKIQFIVYDSIREIDKPEFDTGIVVDAFTKVRGRISGKSEVFLGCGSGETNGKTKSYRMYKVEVYDKYDENKELPKYVDIYDWQLRKIISFAGQINQEINEEKLETE